MRGGRGEREREREVKGGEERCEERRLEGGRGQVGELFSGHAG